MSTILNLLLTVVKKIEWIIAICDRRANNGKPVKDKRRICCFFRYDLVNDLIHKKEESEGVYQLSKNVEDDGDYRRVYA